MQEETICKLKAEVKRLQDKKDIVLKVIASINDNILSALLIHRYVKDLEWIDVARAIFGDSKRNREDYLRKDLNSNALQAFYRKMKNNPQIPPKTHTNRHSDML